MEYPKLFKPNLSKAKSECFFSCILILWHIIKNQRFFLIHMRLLWWLVVAQMRVINYQLDAKVLTVVTDSLF